MRLNVLKDKLNVNPDQPIEISKRRYFEIFFRLLHLSKNRTLSDNEIIVMSVLCSKLDIIETGISKNNLPPVFKKLNEKGLMDGKELSSTGKMYRDKLDENMEIVMNFKIIDINGDGTG